MTDYVQFISKRLPRAGKVPDPLVADDVTLEVMYILDVFGGYAFPGAPWLPDLVEEAVRQIAALKSRNRGAYAWARQDFLRIARGLDEQPEPVAIPREFLRNDPVALLRNNPEVL